MDYTEAWKLLEVMGMFITLMTVDSSMCVHTSKLFTLDLHSLFYIKYISINLFLKLF